MKRTICIILALILTLGALPFAISANDEPFTDIKPEDWFYGSAKFCREKGIFYGDQSGALDPQKNMTRAQFVQGLYAIEGCPTPKIKTNPVGDIICCVDGSVGYFCDIIPEKWYTNAISWAYESGLIAGVGGDRFDPNAPLTREQAAVMLYAFTVNYKKSTSIRDLVSAHPAMIEDLDDYSDAKEVGPWARKALQWAIDTGLLSGTRTNPVTNLPDYIAPKGAFTRGQAVVVFSHFYSLVCETTLPLGNLDLKVTAYAYNGHMPMDIPAPSSHFGICFEGEGLTRDMISDVYVAVWGRNTEITGIPMEFSRINGEKMIYVFSQNPAVYNTFPEFTGKVNFADGEQLSVNVLFTLTVHDFSQQYQVTLYPIVETVW